MRKFSRWMRPLQPTPLRSRDWLVLVIILGGLFPFVLGRLAENGLAIGVVFAVYLLLRAIAKLANDGIEDCSESARKGESIGAFARAFDRRNEPFDPWVVRATWDALKPYTNDALRTTDRLVEDLCIADEEIDMALLGEVAERSGHSLADLEENPYFAKFSTFRNVTVGDFVKLISWQPKMHEDSNLSRLRRE